MSIAKNKMDTTLLCIECSSLTGNCSNSYLKVCFFSFAEIYLETHISSEPMLQKSQFSTVL